MTRNCTYALCPAHVEDHEPFDCQHCGSPACYGINGLWYCSTCWQQLDMQERMQVAYDE